MKYSRIIRGRGFTLVELMIWMPVSLLVVAILFTAVWTGMNLAARNVSVNLAHMNARLTMERLTGEIHQAIKKPQLLGPLTSGSYPYVTGSATGIAMEVYYAGPYTLTAAYDGSSGSPLQMTITDPAIHVVAGMHLVMPTFNNSNNDLAISSVTVTGSTVSCYPTAGTGIAIALNAPYPVYVVTPVKYTISGNNLVRMDDTGDVKTVVPNVSPATPTPFNTASTASRFIQICLGASNPDYSRRGYQAVDMLYSVWVPYRGDLQ